MNAQKPGFSAAYDNRSGSQYTQPTGGYTQPAATLPTGQETAGVSQSPMMTAQQQLQGMPSASTLPITDLTQPQAVTTESLEYLNGFLRTQIGSRVRVEFLIGTNTYTDKSGKLLAVGANYIILQQALSDDLLVCDFFNIKFITIYR